MSRDSGRVAIKLNHVIEKEINEDSQLEKYTPAL